jgi:hypothetical protein
MPEPMDAQDFAGPHPTCREFVAQLAVWGFTERGQKDVHTIFRGPRGGTLRVLRSQLGRADPALVEKAARLAGVTPAQFWAGPLGAGDPGPPPETALDSRGGRKRATHDSVISLVLGIHAEADRPLGFDQVVELAGNRVTRAQVSAASSALCRGGHLDRIRAGVYQWAAGQRAATRPPAARQPTHMPAAELFSQLFPSGVQMTGELLADLEQWARLTGKLAAGGGSSTAA